MLNEQEIVEFRAFIYDRLVAQGFSDATQIMSYSFKPHYINNPNTWTGIWYLAYKKQSPVGTSTLKKENQPERRIINC